MPITDKSGEVVRIQSDGKMYVEWSDCNMKKLQGMVGGKLAEIPTVIATDVVMLTDESAKLNGKPLNKTATDTAFFVNYHDTVEGDAVLVQKKDGGYKGFRTGTARAIVNTIKKRGYRK